MRNTRIGEAIKIQTRPKIANSGNLVQQGIGAHYLPMTNFSFFFCRFITGTDFVASFGDKLNYPGLLGDEAVGCQKSKKIHAEQVMDTSSINMFFSDDAFHSIVLGKNYFKLLGISETFGPPPMCSLHTL